MPGVENPDFVRVLSTSAGSSREMITTSSTSFSCVVSAKMGGTVSNGIFSLYFPPGALAEDTEITIDMPRYPEAVVELGPHGIQFDRTVTLSLDRAMIDSAAGDISVVWYNEETGRWVEIGSSTDDIIEAGLEHFSRYGLSPNG